MICTDENNAVIFPLSPGSAGDALCGRELIKKLGKQKKQRYFLMDNYAGDNTRFLAQSLNFKPIVPPKSNRKSPWIFDKVLYKSRNKVERLFRKIKRFRRIFTRYDKLDSIFLFFIYFTFIFDYLLRVNRP